VQLAPSSRALVRYAVVDALMPYANTDLTGVSCIAPGADTIFAHAVLDLGGRLEVILPATDYRDDIDDADTADFDGLLTLASSVRTLPFRAGSRIAYDAASRAMVNSELDGLYAVWDGKDDGAIGNTASVVAYARMVDVPVRIIWPAGAERCRPD
jgi:hypothetical protein